jgi:hypothetical protein
MRRQCQHAGGLRGSGVGTEYGVRLNDIDDVAIAVQVKQIEGHANTPFGQSSEGRKPKALTGLESEGSNAVFELRKRQICPVDLEAEEAFASLVISTKFP